MIGTQDKSFDEINLMSSEHHSPELLIMLRDVRVIVLRAGLRLLLRLVDTVLVDTVMRSFYLNVQVSWLWLTFVEGCRGEDTIEKFECKIGQSGRGFISVVHTSSWETLERFHD